MGHMKIVDQRVYFYGSTESAYDDSQCRETIRSGDVLVARDAWGNSHEPEGARGWAVAILVEAWPVWICGTVKGQFHTTLSGWDWSRVEANRGGMTYDMSASLRLAQSAALRFV